MAAIDEIAQKEIARLQRIAAEQLALLKEARKRIADELALAVRTCSLEDGSIPDAQDESHVNALSGLLDRVDAAIAKAETV